MLSQVTSVGDYFEVEVPGEFSTRGVQQALAIGIDYDVYCFPEEDLCTGCRQRLYGASSSAVQVRMKDQTPPRMTLVKTVSTSSSEIRITLRVDEGARVYCAAWTTANSATLSRYPAAPCGHEAAKRRLYWDMWGPF